MRNSYWPRIIVSSLSYFILFLIYYIIIFQLLSLIFFSIVLDLLIFVLMKPLPLTITLLDYRANYYFKFRHIRFSASLFNIDIICVISWCGFQYLVLNFSIDFRDSLECRREIAKYAEDVLCCWPHSPVWFGKSMITIYIFKICNKEIIKNKYIQ